ncbi:MAG TPA: tRNA (pseudouridine(54)-N(1))-methyltransferase TrmY [Geobacterales bacterium]|nr:tRNA (pseudouridine(54)-N(1))-methyltransferase TrmY [Geobacterales bacterium]
MREFVLFSRTGLTRPFFVNDLVKANRMDIVARSVSNALFISFGIRKNVTFYVSLNGPPQPPVLITFKGDELKGMFIDEKSVGIRINEALKKVQKQGEINVSEGIYVSKKPFEVLIKEKTNEGKKLIYLDKEGIDIKNYRFTGNEMFIIGDKKGLPLKVTKFLERIGAEKISLGRIEYLASHCITILNYELDRLKL